MRSVLNGRAAIHLAVAVLAALFLTLHGTTEAQGHSAVRSFSAEWVEPGGRLEVSVSAEGYGAIGQVVETLPEGFVYQGSDMPEAAVSVEGRTIAFTLFQSSSFTYVVTAPAEEGRYAFTGTVKDQTRQERPVTGASAVRVGPQPTPEPTATPEATPTPTATATPAATPTPAATAVPTAIPSPSPATVATLAPALRPTVAPGVTPAVSPTPQLTATPQPTATPTPSDSMDGLPAWAIAAIVGGVAALFAGGLAGIYILARRRREDRRRYSRW